MVLHSTDLLEDWVLQARPEMRDRWQATFQGSDSHLV